MGSGRQKKTKRNREKIRVFIETQTLAGSEELLNTKENVLFCGKIHDSTAGAQGPRTRGRAEIMDKD